MLFRCKPLRKAVKSEVSCKKVLGFVTRCRASQFYLCTAAFSSCKSTAPGIKTLPSVYWCIAGGYTQKVYKEMDQQKLSL